MQAQKGYDLAGKSIFIALPAYDFKVSLKLAVSLARFTQVAGQHGITIQIGSICGCSVVSRARNLLVQDMLESTCDYLLFIDSDINFGPSNVFRAIKESIQVGQLDSIQINKHQFPDSTTDQHFSCHRTHSSQSHHCQGLFVNDRPLGHHTHLRQSIQPTIHLLWH